MNDLVDGVHMVFAVFIPYCSDDLHKVFLQYRSGQALAEFTLQIAVTLAFRYSTVRVALLLSGGDLKLVGHM